jgi:hypothetical protein
MKRYLLWAAIPLALQISTAMASDTRCDTPLVAQVIISDMFANNPSAKKLGLKLERVTVISVDENGDCIVWVETNHNYAIKYRFGYHNGSASLDMLDMTSR